MNANTRCHIFLQAEREALASCMDLHADLRVVLADAPDGLRRASVMSWLYVDALNVRRERDARLQRWRRFVNALDHCLQRAHARERSAAADRLAAVVRENMDLVTERATWAA